MSRHAGLVIRHPGSSRSAGACVREYRHSQGTGTATEGEILDEAVINIDTNLNLKVENVFYYIYIFVLTDTLQGFG